MYLYPCSWAHSLVHARLWGVLNADFQVKLYAAARACFSVLQYIFPEVGVVVVTWGFNRGSSASGAFATLLRDNLIKKGILIRLQLLAVVSKILWALELTGMQTRPSNQLC